MSKRTPETPMPLKYRASKASAFTPQSRRIPRDRKDREREQGSSSSGSGSGSIGKTRTEQRRKFDKPPDVTSPSSSPIVMLRVGPEKRLFAAHEAILTTSPFFASVCASQTPSPTAPRPRPPLQSPGKRFDLPDEQPEVLSCVLEYLYKGDYYPRLRHNTRKQTWELEDARGETEGELSQATATVFHHAVGGVILRDTAIYCAAQKYNLPHLQRLALRKQGLHTGIQCSTILASARYAYANTPDTESKLRAHYLALIVRSRSTFMRSGTMQAEMERGGKLFFDLFVAMCNHMDDYVPGESVSSSVSTTRC